MWMLKWQKKDSLAAHIPGTELYYISREFRDANFMPITAEDDHVFDAVSGYEVEEFLAFLWSDNDTNVNTEGFFEAKYEHTSRKPP